MNPNQPFGQPKGTVRAALALYVVIVVVALGAALALLAMVDPEKAFLSLIGLATMVLNGYFLTRKDAA